MTNGEKLKEIFPNAEISIIKYEHGRTKVAVDWKFEQIPSYYNLFYEDWWNAEYKESTTRNCFGCKYSKDNHNAGTEECHLCMWENQYTPDTKNNLAVDCIDRAELLKAMDTWDKFGNIPNRGLIPLRTSALQGIYVTYVKYEDMVNCVKGMFSATSQPRKGHWIEHPHEAGPNWEYSRYECSECHDWAEDDSDYCPYCGADMREV